MELTATIKSTSLTYDQMMFFKKELDEAMSRALQTLFDAPPADFEAIVTVK